MTGLMARAQRLERHSGLLGLAKLANVGLAMAWGFVVTFVFVRLLPLDEFKAFLLLVAFANFTVSAEFGFSTIVYSRLRRYRLASDGGFRTEELGVLLLFMAGIVGLGALLVGAGLTSGFISTGRPGLFLAFYGVAAMNLFALLAKRSLAALDHNLWWEGLDFIRRASSIALLIAALFGLPLIDSVLAQLALGVVTVAIGLATVHGALAMPARHWLAWRAGGGHVRRNYLGDLGRTVVLTISDIAAYNAPYFIIVAATRDARPLLLFDFLFKMSRALSAIIRALVETMMPAFTRARHKADRVAQSALLKRTLALSFGLSLILGAALFLEGSRLSALMFDRRIMLNRGELALIAALLIGLTPLCVSVYVQTALGRFSSLIAPSAFFLAGSLASVPVAQLVAQHTAWPFALVFVVTYASVHLLIGVVHARMLVRLVR